ncbi:hypothetical protein ACFV2S_30295 [Streptomyces sp. NPDC059695]|uniref:hypothetical protein n=1 Tax=Streptomyces sp. NPDC059695 TaxID=3346910 RepID=UPI0036B1DD71
MRPEVQAFAAGPLPDRDGSEEEIDRHLQQLEAISQPVTGEGARTLASHFGTDDCHDVARTLLHLIGTRPNPVLTTAPGADPNDWRQRLYPRAVNRGLIPEPDGAVT